MDRMWAPWRKKYVTLKNNTGCIFCKSRKAGVDRKNLILRRGEHSFSMLNRYPYSNGHVMVAPSRHVKSLELLNEKELLDIMKLVNHTKKKIDRTLKPHGYNIGANVGKVAGAGFPGHVHIHVVPRWNGDTNFMPVLGQTKVLPCSLEEMYERLKG